MSMNHNCRNTSLASGLVIVILLCSIVCSATNVFGHVIPAQFSKIIKKEASSTQLSAQLAEQVGSENEEDSRHDTPVFEIETFRHHIRTILTAPGTSSLVRASRIDGHRNIIPIYLVERTIRI